MIKPLYITRPAQRDPVQPDVPALTDIDWRKVTVAEAIDTERQRKLETLARLKAAREAKRRGFWRTVAQVFGVRR